MLHARKLTGVEQVLCDARFENNLNSNSDIESEPVWSRILSAIENARLKKNYRAILDMGFSQVAIGTEAVAVTIDLEI
ncbi:MAG: hypothetical protein ABJ360_09600 [Roseobacter sp.]